MNKPRHPFIHLRKGLFALTLMAVSAIPLDAQTPAKEALVVYMTDGSKVAYVLETKPSVQFGETMLMIDSPEISDSHSIAKIANFRFEPVQPTSGILKPAADVRKITVTDTEVRISGLQPGSTVTAADIQGRVLYTATTPDNGVASIPTERFTPGVYVIAASDFHSFKIYKR